MRAPGSPETEAFGFGAHLKAKTLVCGSIGEADPEAPTDRPMDIGKGRSLQDKGRL